MDCGRSCEQVTILITEDMVALLICNHQQSQDASTQTVALKSRIISDDSPGLDLLERRLMTRDLQVIPLMPRSSDLEWVSREMGAAFMMGGALYLPWLLGVLEERPGRGYWLSFTQRLPISFETGDRLYGLMHQGQLPRDEEDAEGEITEDTVEEEVI